MTNEFHYQKETATADSAEVSAACRETQDDIESRLSHIWQELLGIDSVGLDENYFDLGGDSALTIQLFAQVEKAFKIKIPLPMLFEAPTVREFARVLRTAGADRGVSPLVPMQPAGSRPPFFCIHGTAGDVSIYQDLARHLAPDQPFYGLQSQGLDGNRPPLTRIEDMAALYLEEIRKLQPQGPYFLGGYRMGGTIALEMAQQLQKSGEVVGFLAFFDTINWSRVPPPSVLSRGYYVFQQWKFRAANLLRARSGEVRVAPEKPARQQVSPKRRRSPLGTIPIRIVCAKAGVGSKQSGVFTVRITVVRGRDYRFSSRKTVRALCQARDEMGPPRPRRPGNRLLARLSPRHAQGSVRQTLGHRSEQVS
jgi:pimeloyl-ACP methyl ester carboxylesterase